MLVSFSMIPSAREQDCHLWKHSTIVSCYRKQPYKGAELLRGKGGINFLFFFPFLIQLSRETQICRCGSLGQCGYIYTTKSPKLSPSSLSLEQFCTSNSNGNSIPILMGIQSSSNNNIIHTTTSKLYIQLDKVSLSFT